MDEAMTEMYDSTADNTDSTNSGDVVLGVGDSPIISDYESLICEPDTSVMEGDIQMSETKKTAITVDAGNEEVAKLFEDAGYVLTYAAIGDLEKTPILDRYVLNRNYVDNLVNVISSGFHGQCAILIAIRPVPASANASHSGFGQDDDLLATLDRQAMQRAQARMGGGQQQQMP